MKAFSHFFLSTLALGLASFSTSLRAATLPVTVTVVEPLENGQLIYAPVGALSADVLPTGRLWFKLGITNNGRSDLTLANLGVVINAVEFYRAIDDVECPAGESATFSLKDSEVVTMPHPAPATVRIRLYFADNLTPEHIDWPLAPYAPPVAGGAYLFPADEGDIGPEEYFGGGTHEPTHNQGWGTDWRVYRIDSNNDYTDVLAGYDGTENSHKAGWGVPIRALADGIVLRTKTGWIDNPRPGERAFSMMAEYDGEAVSDVKVTRLSETRAASLQRLPSGQVQLSVWSITNVGRSITRLGSSPLVPRETVSDMAITALTDTRVAGLLRLSGNNNQRVIVWDILDDGLTVTQKWATTSTGALEVSLMKMASSRFATGARTEAGDVQVGVWEVDGTGIHSRATGSGGAATSICTTVLSGTRFASSLRSDSGRLKVIVWDYVNGSPLLSRRGEDTAENISRVAATSNDGGKWVTAMCTPGGVLKLARWYIASETETSMTLGAELVTTTTQAIQNTALAIAPATGSKGTIHVATAAILDDGNFKINGWGNDPKESPNAYEYSAQNTADAVSTVSIDQTEDLVFVAAARTAGGTLKLMTWNWATDGNGVYVLHGNCRVLYAHFREGSVNTNVLYPGATVTAGQVLGRMGNSGSSGDVHTHIHADRIADPLPPIDVLLALEAAGEIKPLLIGTRPIPFRSARAMQLGDIVRGGEGTAVNAFATLNGHGTYNPSLGIRPRLNTRYVDRLATALQPTGRKEPLQTLPVIGGPFPQVAPALGVVPSGGRLYIRGGNYDETITFSKPMTVRRYDYYDTNGSVLIGR
jgi:hypothetical protein